MLEPRGRGAGHKLVRHTLLDISPGLPLRGLLSVPYGHERQSSWPMLVFLHGSDDAAPGASRALPTRHGPLRPNNNGVATSEFVVVAPRLPETGDAWHRYGAALALVLHDVEDQYRIDPDRIYLTGFGYGANGVFDLALRQAYPFAALWAVDPTRLPAADPGLPIWLSAGPLSRAVARQYVMRLRLTPASTPGSERVYVDDGVDHESTATLAYADARGYRWLLRRHRRAATAAVPELRSDLRR